MSSPERILSSLLASLGVAVLRRTGPRQYAVYGTVPSFYERLFPGENGNSCLEPWRYSRVLSLFVEDAELFFAGSAQGVLRSDIWKEEGVQNAAQALSAMALCVEDEQLLLIRLLEQAATGPGRLSPPGRSFLAECLAEDASEDAETRTAYFDPLTSLLNKDVFMAVLARKVEQADRSGDDFSLALLDLDDFQGVNDVYGHEAGDQVLAAIGQLLRQLLRREDIPARIGGEEFAVLACHTQQHQALRMAEKLRTVITEHNFDSLPFITVSIGCATYQPGENVASLFDRAQRALSEAKKDGKNMVRVL